MHESTCIPSDRSTLHLQVEADQAASTECATSVKRTQRLWTGLGLLSLIGLSAWAVHTPVSRAGSSPPSISAPLVAFNPGPALRVGRFQEKVRSMRPVAEQRVVVSKLRATAPIMFGHPASKADAASRRWPWQNAEGEDSKKKPDPLAQIKKYGVAGIVSYGMWALAVDTFGGVGCFAVFYATKDRWPDFTNPEDTATMAAEAVSFVSLAALAVPLRIGLAVATAPWVKENIITRFSDNILVKEVIKRCGVDVACDVDWEDFADDFKVVSDKLDATVRGVDAKQLFELVSATPFSDRNVEIEKDVSTGANGEKMLGAKWKFEIQESELKDAQMLGESKNILSFPLAIQGDTFFSLNEDGKVSSMRIGSLLLNGEELTIPDFENLSESEEAALQKWAKDMVSLDEKSA